MGRRPERALVAAGGLVTQPRPAPDGATHVSMACCVVVQLASASLRETRLFIVGSTSSVEGWRARVLCGRIALGSELSAVGAHGVVT